MTRRPVIAVLEGGRPVRGLERVAGLADVRVTGADGLARALDGADEDTTSADLQLETLTALLVQALEQRG